MVPRILLAVVLVAVVAPAVGAVGGIQERDRVVEPPPLSRPAVGVPFMDPAFGTSLTRVSGTSESGAFASHVYSQLQAFSYDSELLLLTSASGYRIIRVADFSTVDGIDASGWNDPRWHPTQPRVILHFDSNDDATVRLQHTDVDEATVTTVFTFPPRYQYVRAHQSFDEVSKDGRWVAGLLTRDDGTSAIFALDMVEGRLGAELAMPDLYAVGGPCAPDPEWGIIEPDWIGMSPTGRHLVAQWARDGTQRCSGLETFDPETGAFLGRAYAGHQHGDLGLDADGNEFFMTFSLSSAEDRSRPGIAIHALPGTNTESPPTHLLTLDWATRGAEHISCQGPRGVCLVTYGADPATPWTPFEDEIALVYTNGSVLRLAHHRSSGCGYWVQPRASLSEDGRHVVFASDWSAEGTQTSCERWSDDLGVGDPYIIALDADAAARPAPDPSAPSSGAVVEGDGTTSRGADDPLVEAPAADSRPTPGGGLLAALAVAALAARSRRR